MYKMINCNNTSMMNILQCSRFIKLILEFNRPWLGCTVDKLLYEQDTFRIQIGSKGRQSVLVPFQNYTVIQFKHIPTFLEYTVDL